MVAEMQSLRNPLMKAPIQQLYDFDLMPIYLRLNLVYILAQ